MQAFARHWLRAEIALAVTIALLGVFLLVIPADYYEWINADPERIGAALNVGAPSA